MYLGSVNKVQVSGKSFYSSNVIRPMQPQAKKTIMVCRDPPLYDIGTINPRRMAGECTMTMLHCLFVLQGISWSKA
jgi:hypothetical protein